MWLINTENVLRFVLQNESNEDCKFGTLLQENTRGFLRSTAASSRLDTSKDLFLEQFFNEEIMQYAILSHTWPAEGSKLEEVSFQEMVLSSLSPRTVMKWGFGKIVKTCEEALMKHNLGCAWVDTCCIEKSSSSELSEAINSMLAPGGNHQREPGHVNICFDRSSARS
jgi:hypothetical protein